MAEVKGLTYPAQLYADIFENVQLDHTKKALEIGIGMGQATGQILDTGCALTAVEQDEKMVSICKDIFADRCFAFDTYTLYTQVLRRE